MTENSHPCKFRRDKGSSIDWMTFSTGGIFLILLIGFLRFARPVLLPVILALLLMLVFQPVANALIKSLRLPRFLAALVIVLGFTGSMGIAGYFFSEPVSDYAKQLESKEVKERLTKAFSPITKIHNDISGVANEIKQISKESSDPPPEDEEGNQAGEEAGKKTEEPTEKKLEKETKEVTGEDTINSSPPAKQEEERPVAVEIQNDPVSLFYTGLQNFGFYVLSTLFLLLFLLAYGPGMAQRMGEVRGTPELLEEIQQDISGYLFTISAINFFLGLSIALGLWIIEIPHAPLWGLMAMLLNFLPYAGAVIGTVIIALIAAMESSSVGTSITAALIYFGLSAIEGNILTPAIIGKRFEINPIIVFLWVLAWASIWGVAGMLIGLPLLMAFRILCSRVPSLARIERVITL